MSGICVDLVRCTYIYISGRSINLLIFYAGAVHAYILESLFHEEEVWPLCIGILHFPSLAKTVVEGWL